MSQFPWSDNEIRSFYVDAKDPVGQVFVVAELCDVKPVIALNKLCEMCLITSDIRKSAIQAIREREEAERISREVILAIQARRRTEYAKRKEQKHDGADKQAAC